MANSDGVGVGSGWRAASASRRAASTFSSRVLAATAAIIASGVNSPAAPGTDYTLSAFNGSIVVPANSTVDYTAGFFMPLQTTASFPLCLSGHNFSVQVDVTAKTP